MACRKCGGKGPVTPVSETVAAELRATGDMVFIEYIGTQTQKQRLRSKVSPREWYIFGAGTTKFYAYKGDVEWLTAMASQFKIAEDVLLVSESAVTNVPVLTSEMKVPVYTDLPIDVLQLDPITVGLLKREFSTVNEVRNAGRAEWMLIKGIGAIRADEIEEALNAIQK